MLKMVQVSNIVLNFKFYASYFADKSHTKLQLYVVDENMWYKNINPLKINF